RSGATFSMPGMMDTVLNLGLNDASVVALARATNDERFAYDSYRRFIAMYGRIVLGVDAQRFEHPLEQRKAERNARADADLPASALGELCTHYKLIIKQETGKDFPQIPAKQLRGAIEAVFRSWNGARAVAYRTRERISHDLGTAVNVQAMVFGNRNDQSGTGVGFTRNPATGENVAYGDFLTNAQGEDVVAGIRNTESLDELERKFPDVHTELLDIFARLEHHYKDMCDTEFTIENGTLWMLQTRIGKRTGAAALRMAVEMTKSNGTGKRRWSISRKEAITRVTAEHLDSVLHPQFARVIPPLVTGLGASPGAAVGTVYFTSDSAADAAKRGERVILVRHETSPEDVHGMMAASGIVTSRGGLVSHAAVVARGWGTPAVVGAESLKIDGKRFTVGDTVVHEGETISIDGTTGAVMVGALELVPATPTPEFHTILKWA
ncbi:MAG: PEP/pyruvate-binding domain-containing protein, partial [Ilumatobacteraceae bacterium]